MKTAEEWINESRKRLKWTYGLFNKENVEAIQSDAHAQGMRDAAKFVHQTQVTSDPGNFYMEANERLWLAEQAILAAAANEMKNFPARGSDQCSTESPGDVPATVVSPGAADQTP